MYGCLKVEIFWLLKKVILGTKK